MSDRSPPTNLTLAHALHLARAGFLVFPCRRGDKRPATNNGLLDATTDESVIRAWFNNDRGFNLAVACGPQPNGINLVAIDVDPKNGGDVTWANLINGHTLPPCPVHTTPSGGLHLFFDAPSTLHNTSGRLGPGIDTRGAGGYVVVPPSKIIDSATGEVSHYTTSREAALAEATKPPLEAWLEALWDDQAASMARHPSQASIIDLGDSVADKAREGWDWSGELEADGWTLARRRGDQEFWTRPDKSARDGHSGVLHLPDGPLVVWSTERPPGGRTNPDGSSSFSPWDYIRSYRAGGDARRAAALVRGRPTTASGTGGNRGATDDDTPGDDGPSLNLPGSFWEARPILAQIRQAAWAAGCSPDALFVQTLARVATFVHPCFKLPGVEQGLIGKPQTLDFLGCVVAETSGGKTLAAGVAELLVPAPDPPSDGSDPLIDFDQKVGSGEGIAEFFLVPEMAFDDDGKAKPTGRRVIGKQALFMNVDEGTGFTNQAGRKGTTIIATLASAWSGEGIGQLNASDETRRLIRGGRVRICAVINMQDSNGYKLYTDDLESVGFTGRLMFATAHDPSAPVPERAPDWPGPLRWPIRPGNLSAPVFFTYAPEIVTEIKMTRHGILTRRVRIERRQSQYLLLRCKVAALLAVLDGRIDVTVDDWKLATEAITCSSSNLGNLDRVHSSQIEVTAVTAAAFKMQVAETAEAQHLRRLAIGWKPRVLDRLAKRGPQPWKGLKDIVHNDHREALRQVVNEMVDEGVLTCGQGTYEIRR